jgi:hypothetical protein
MSIAGRRATNLPVAKFALTVGFGEASPAAEQTPRRFSGQIPLFPSDLSGGRHHRPDPGTRRRATKRPLPYKAGASAGRSVKKEAAASSGRGDFSSSSLLRPGILPPLGRSWLDGQRRPDVVVKHSSLCPDRLAAVIPRTWYGDKADSPRSDFSWTPDPGRSAARAGFAGVC